MPFRYLALPIPAPLGPKLSRLILTTVLPCSSKSTKCGLGTGGALLLALGTALSGTLGLLVLATLGGIGQLSCDAVIMAL